MPTTLIAQIDALLPQTQCTKCGYPSCHAYASAIAANEASHNQCPPGGQAGIVRLAHLLQRPILPLNSQHGSERARSLAVIEEKYCIGCTLCIQACPVDAIVGAPKQMHFIVPELCTGCDLCIEPCPVDCISMLTITATRTGWAAWSPLQAEQARLRYTLRQQRLQREKQENEERLGRKASAKLHALEQEADAHPEQRREIERKKAVIAAAIERARLKKIAADQAKEMP